MEPKEKEPPRAQEGPALTFSAMTFAHSADQVNAERIAADVGSYTYDPTKPVNITFDLEPTPEFPQGVARFASGESASPFRSHAQDVLGYAMHQAFDQDGKRVVGTFKLSRYDLFRGWLHEHRDAISWTLNIASLVMSVIALVLSILALKGGA